MRSNEGNKEVKGFTKGQKIFLGAYPIAGLALFLLCTFLFFAGENSAVAVALARLLTPLILVVFTPAYAIASFVNAMFHLHWVFLYFIVVAYHFLLGFIFVLAYKRIKNR